MLLKKIDKSIYIACLNLAHITYLKELNNAFKQNCFKFSLYYFPINEKIKYLCF